MVDKVRIRAAAGGEFSVAARLFVLAAGGIENPRLLLLSNQTYPEGLGNGNDLVGRFFMEHLVVNRGVLQPRSRELFRNLKLYQRNVVDGVPILGALRLRESVLREQQLLSVVLSPFVGQREFFSEGFRSLATFVGYLKQRRLPRRALKTLYDIARSVPATARGSYLLLSHADLSQPSFLGMLPHMEQSPQADNRVTLSRERDQLGLQRAQLTWRAGDLEEHSLRRTMDIFGDEVASAGIGKLQFKLSPGELRRLFHVSHHNMGATRMHHDPKQGVVDQDCRVHGTANLFIAGSSVFPTSGGATVTLTALALAIRLADHIKTLLSDPAIRVSSATASLEAGGDSAALT